MVVRSNLSAFVAPLWVRRHPFMLLKGNLFPAVSHRVSSLLNLLRTLPCRRLSVVKRVPTRQVPFSFSQKCGDEKLLRERVCLILLFLTVCVEKHPAVVVVDFQAEIFICCLGLEFSALWTNAGHETPPVITGDRDDTLPSSCC